MRGSKIKHLLLPFCFLLAWPVAGSGAEEGHDAAEPAIRVLFREISVASGESFTLGDIAEVKSADPSQALRLGALELGRSPEAGSRLPLSSSQLTAMLDRQGIGKPEADLVFPVRMFLEREVQELDRIALEAALKEQLHDEMAGVATEGLVIDNIQLPSRVVLPAGNLAYDISMRLPRRQVGTVSFTVSCLVDGRAVRTVAGSMRIDREMEVLQSESALVRGQRLDPASCRVVRRLLSQMPTAPITLDDLNQGNLTARRNLAPGELLNWSNLQREILIQRGETIQMVLETPDGMRISVQGQARTSGALGDPIEVLNTSSGKIVQAQVAGSRMARVFF